MSQPVKVLLCGQDPSLPGGMAKYIGSLQDYLCGNDEVQLRFLNETKAKGRSGMTSKSTLASLREGVRLLREFDRLLVIEKPDVVHLHMAYGRSILEKSLLANRARKRKIPVLLHLHGSRADAEIAGWSAARSNLLDQRFNKPHKLIVLSSHMKAISQRAMPNVNAVVLPNAVDLQDPRPDINLDEPCIGFIGFLDGRKGELDLIRALDAIRDQRWTACVAGDGPTGGEARELTASLGLQDRIEFLGFVDGEAKRAFFHRITMLCLPSYAENFPISLLEAMGYGRPVVSTPVGGIPELVGADCGYLVPPGRHDLLGGRISQLLSHPDEALEMGLRCWNKVRDQFTWDVVGPRLLQLYRAN
jgi:glycosyltransferase involved in cell wall biosynthesis